MNPKSIPEEQSLRLAVRVNNKELRADMVACSISPFTEEETATASRLKKQTKKKPANTFSRSILFFFSTRHFPSITIAHWPFSLFGPLEIVVCENPQSNQINNLLNSYTSQPGTKNYGIVKVSFLPHSVAGFELPLHQTLHARKCIEMLPRDDTF